MVEFMLRSHIWYEYDMLSAGKYEETETSEIPKQSLGSMKHHCAWHHEGFESREAQNGSKFMSHAEQLSNP